MYRVDFRFAGQGLWNTMLAASLQSAVGQQRAFQTGKFADEARIVPTTPQRLDQRV